MCSLKGKQASLHLDDIIDTIDVWEEYESGQNKKKKGSLDITFTGRYAIADLTINDRQDRSMGL
jgi:hypothetical protein